MCRRGAYPANRVCRKVPGLLVAERLAVTRAITKNIKKARRAFFAYGSIGAFQGDLSPLSSRSVVETCVIPVLLFGSENWLLNRAMISSLEAFQGEIAKKILKWLAISGK